MKYTRVYYCPPDCSSGFALDDVRGAITAEQVFINGRFNGDFWPEDDVGGVIVADVFENGAIIDTTKHIIHNEDFMLG